MPDRPVLSVVLVTWNHLPHTAEAVGHLAQYTTLPGELIVVDNASRDGTPAFLSRLPDPVGSLRVRRVQNRENLGYPFAVNQGLSLAAGSYVVLLNNDVLVPPHWAEDLIAALEADPGLGLVGPVSNHVSGVQLRPRTYDPAGFVPFAQAWRLRPDHHVVPTDRLVGFLVMARREVVEKVGGLDPRFSPGNFEDDDWGRRARRAGFGLAVVTRVYAHHFGSVSFGADPEWFDGLLRRNQGIFLRKWAHEQRASRPLMPVPTVTPSSDGGFRAVVLPDFGRPESWPYRAMHALGAMEAAGPVGILLDPEVESEDGGRAFWATSLALLPDAVRARLAIHVEAYPWTEFLSRAAHPGTEIWRLGSPMEPVFQALLEPFGVVSRTVLPG